LLRFFAPAMCLLVAIGGAARAAEPLDESERWVPAFGPYFEILGQKAHGSLTAGDVLGPPLPAGCDDGSPGGDLCPSNRPNPQEIIADSAGHDTSMTPMVGGSLELMTPRLVDGFLRPRLFAHGDLAYAFSFERNLAGQESPGEFAPPEHFGQTNLDIEELSVQGQGSRTRLQVRPLVLSAGAGVALGFDLFGRRFRVKPSFEYLHYELDLIGVVHRAVKVADPAMINSLEDFRLISLTRIEQEEYDGVGPGLELEADTVQLGPFLASVYINGRAYHLFGDLETTFSAANEFGETVSWTFDPDPWVWRGGVGIRFRWVPEQ
jgi:hypothetical protein